MNTFGYIVVKTVLKPYHLWVGLFRFLTGILLAPVYGDGPASCSEVSVVDKMETDIGRASSNQGHFGEQLAR